VYHVQSLLGRHEDDLPLVYARQVAEAIATAASRSTDGGSKSATSAAATAAGTGADVLSAGCPLLLGVAMRDRSPEAYRAVLAALDRVRVW
jgi:hypothetical protein